MKPKHKKPRYVNLDRKYADFILQLNTFYSIKLYNNLLLSHIYAYASTNIMKLAITEMIDEGELELRNIKGVLKYLGETYQRPSGWNSDELLLQRYLNLLKSCTPNFEGDLGIIFNLMINDSIEIALIKLLNAQANTLGYKFLSLSVLHQNKVDHLNMFQDLYTVQLKAVN